MIYSDHCPFILTFGSTLHHIRPFRWKLNNSLLQNESLVELINKKTKFFFDTNSVSDESFATTWEAYKVTFWGGLISFASNQKKIRAKKLQNQSWKQHIRQSQRTISCIQSFKRPNLKWKNLMNKKNRIWFVSFEIIIFWISIYNTKARKLLAYWFYWLLVGHRKGIWLHRIALSF